MGNTTAVDNVFFPGKTYGDLRLGRVESVPDLMIRLAFFYLHVFAFFQFLYCCTGVPPSILLCFFFFSKRIGWLFFLFFACSRSGGNQSERG